MTNEFGEGDRTPGELPDLPREGRPSIPPPPGRAFAAPRGEDDDAGGHEGDSASGDVGGQESHRDRGERNDRGDRNDRGNRSDRGDRNERGDRSERADRGDRGGDTGGGNGGRSRNRRRRRGGRNRNRGEGRGEGRDNNRRDSRGGRDHVDTEAELIARRKGKERDGRPLGRYLMCVHVRNDLTQVALLEGRSLTEHYVSRPADDATQIHGNIYLGKVQNVLPGMEAAFVDIATPKNAVLYRGDVQFDKEDVVEQGPEPRIEHVLKRGQLILCQVTKNPIGEKGARLTQEVSLPGRFVVLIPDSKTYGISKRLPESERRRLRNVLDRIKPEEHGQVDKGRKIKIY